MTNGVRQFGWTRLEMFCNSFRDTGTAHYTLVRKSPRPTKDAPEKFIYVIDLHIPLHKSVLHFTPEGNVEEDWQDREINGAQ